ncbi:MAG: flippase [Acidobacteriota bacterium]|nr:flippase [Acidobacteriota bacterium]
MQLRTRHIARNVLFNWLGTVANMAVGFFLAPFILHRLGTLAYGVWVLAISVVAYLSLLDLGMQSSVLRFVSKGHTQGDHQGASDAISAALWLRLQISALVLVISGGLAFVFPLVFKVPAELASDARKAVLIIGITTAVTMSIGVVGGVLSALNRYDLQNYASLAQTALRVIGVVIVLRTGHGIVAIAICELIAAIFGNLLLVFIARRLYPELKVRLQKPEKKTFQQIWSYSWYAFLTTIAVQLVYQTDNLVVGAFVSASAVTFYAIANSLCRYASLIVGSMGSTFVPAASTYEAAGDSDSLLRLYKNGTRATLMISLPVLVTLLLRGPSFIGLWMGPEYSRTSGRVLILLATALLFSFANRAAGAIAFGIEKHKMTAIWAIGEGVANLVLSIVLVHWYGIYGVAIGTLVPSLVIHVGLWPGYISKLVGLSAFEVLMRIWAPMFLSSIPFAIATYAIGSLVPAKTLAIFFLQVLATLPIFFLTVGVVFRTYVRSQILPAVKSLFYANAS